MAGNENILDEQRKQKKHIDFNGNFNSFDNHFDGYDDFGDSKAQKGGLFSAFSAHNGPFSAHNNGLSTAEEENCGKLYNFLLHQFDLTRANRFYNPSSPDSPDSPDLSVYWSAYDYKSLFSDPAPLW